MRKRPNIGKSTILTLLMAALSAACTDGEHLAAHHSELVVEGSIENDAPPVVIVTRSVPVMEEKVPIGDLWDYVVRWAKVTVSTKDTSVVLTGRYDDRYFPPYIYTTGRLRGEVGKTYTLTVEYKDYLATAAATIPPPRSLDSIRVEPVAQSDTLYSLTACFTDDPAERDYYQFFVKTGNGNRQYLAAYLGSVTDRVLSGHAEVPVHQGHRFGQKDYTPYFSSGDTVSVKFAHVDSIAHSFWSEYDQAVSLNDNMSFPKTTNLPTNIRGGIGCWCGYGADTRYVIIP